MVRGRMGQPLDLNGYKLTFDDEFNTFSWNGGGHQGTWSTTYSYGERKLNDEQEIYSDPTIGVDPFSIQNGALDITAAPSTDLASTSGQPYTSGVVTTYGSFSQTYGYFEMRAKLPSGQGLWPAFWLLPVQHVWPPELDVFEAFGSKPYQLHWGAQTATSLGNAGDWVNLPADATSAFHRYGVEWTATTLTYYFDGVAVAQTATPADFNQPMYLIANLAVGGHWPGNPTPGTAFPAKLEIDYIRAYSDAPSAMAVAAQPISPADLLNTEAAAAPRAAPPRRTADPINWIDRNGTVGTPGNDYFQTFYGDTATRAGGEGDDTYVITDPRMFIDEKPGEGTDLVQSWIDYTLPANVENITVAATWGLRATGNDESNYVTGNAGDDTLSGGAGGNDVLTGGGGSNTFIMPAGAGCDTITDFQPGDGGQHDTVLLDGFDFASPGAALAALQAEGTDVVLPFDNGQSLTFWNTDRTKFTASNFTLGAIGAPPVTPTPAFIPPTHKLVLSVSEDAYAGDAQFTVTIDGRAMGDTYAATADHSKGQTQPFEFTIPYGDGSHTVDVRFLNDAYGGPGLDRNLYVDSAEFDGNQQQAGSPLYGPGTASFQVGAKPATLAYTATATGLSGVSDLAVYAGPVDYLQWQNIVPGDGGGAFATDRPDVFVLTGAGNDAIQVHSGHNVLDGGGGSNFLVGGSGTDTFFLDARGQAPIWDTVVNFHAGDAVTLWGFAPTDTFTFDPAESGAPGYEGATLRAQIGTFVQSVTFAGLSVSDAAHLRTSTGSTGGVSYLLVQSVS